MKSKHDDSQKKHWEDRTDENWKKFKFNQPYEKGLKRLRQQVLGKTNFDPAVLWQWGTLQAMAVLEILKTMERKYGKEGQEAVFESLRRVGYDLGKQVTEGTTIPDEITDVEWMSFFATVINRIAYASLETPQIEGDKKAGFHIDWCPHQDHYGTLDCRVQRHFVQGILDAARDFAKSNGRDVAWDLAFRTTIPAGAETCYFELWRGGHDDGGKWAEYTKFIEEKALEIAKKESGD